MKKNYIIPSINCRIIYEDELLAATVTPSFPDGSPDVPGFGGDSDGSHPVNSKANIWDNDTAEE